MYKEDVILTNTHRIPLSLTNQFKDTFGLCDDISECNTAEELCEIVNKHYGYGTKTWSIDIDKPDSTRLIAKDTLGNIHYLIAHKEKASNSAFASIPDADLIMELINRGYTVTKA